jgi:hypothetical protein
LEPGGLVVLTVPALPLLWSDEDEVAGHRRRYRPRDLDSFMSLLGFKKVASQYLFASLVIPAFLIRVLPYKLGRRRSEEAILASMAVQLLPSRRIDQVMRRILAFEQFATQRVRLPFGTSVMGLYRRTGEIDGSALRRSSDGQAAPVRISPTSPEGAIASTESSRSAERNERGSLLSVPATASRYRHGQNSSWRRGRMPLR